MSMASTTRGLVVKLSTSNLDVNLRWGSLEVTTTVINTGDETLKLLKTPRGVLDTFPTDTFTITNHAGASPLFIGAMIRYGRERAARLNDPTLFTVLAPAASISVTHDLSVAYDFTQSDPGEYSIEPSNEFYYVDGDCTPHQFYAIVKDPVEVKLSDHNAFSHFYDIWKNPRQAARSIRL